MIKFKVCPRCRGDLYLSEDMFGKYFSCMQCGYLKDIDRDISKVSKGSISEIGDSKIGTRSLEKREAA